MGRFRELPGTDSPYKKSKSELAARQFYSGKLVHTDWVEMALCVSSQEFITGAIFLNCGGEEC